ncbi:MAG: signal peptidase I [Tepidanaerobacteraceae bacterium]|jgi:signal peptidase|nr:signal peptidase I [Tepidanaerobacteraceae bacterium]
MKTALKWLNSILTVVLLLMVACSFFLIYQSRMEPNRAASIMGYKPLTVLSGSMSPFLEPGDMIVVHRVDPASIKVGDVITFRVDDRTLVTHRVAEVIPQDGRMAFRTKGDANNTEDIDLVTQDRVVGSMAFKIPYAGYIGRFARTPKGFVAMIVFPGVLLIAGEIKNILNELSKEQKQRKAHDSDPEQDSSGDDMKA